MAEKYRMVAECPVYMVSNYGNIKRIETVIKANKEGSYRTMPECIPPLVKSRNGYISAIMWYRGVSYKKYIHRLVASAFIPNPDNCPCVNHMDGDKTNNKLENLEWTTYSGNSSHAILTGLRKPIDKNRIVMLDTNNNYIATFVNACVAAEITKISRSSIQACCKPFRTGSNSAGGYYWKYECDIVK